MKEIMLPYIFISWLLFKYNVINNTPRNYVIAVVVGILLALSLFFAHRFYSPADLTKSTTVRAPHAVLSPALGQHIKHIYVDHNQIVKKGELVYTLYDDNVTGHIKELEAQQAEVKASIDSREVALAQAERDFSRYSNLKDHVSERDRETSADLVEVTKADILVLEAKLVGLAAKIGSQNYELTRLQVTAPFDGMVTHIYISDGSRVGSLHLWDTNKKFVEMRIPDQSYSHIKKGQFSEFYIDAYPGQIFRSRVHSVVKATGESQGGILPQEQTVSSHIQRGAPAVGRTVILEVDPETMAQLPIGATGSAWISAQKPFPILGFLDVIGAATIRLHAAKSYIGAL